MSEKGDSLRQLAKLIDQQEKERDSFLAAKAAYRKDPTDANKAKYRKAAVSYDRLRSEARSHAVALPADGASMTVVPQTIRK